jgi:hypothetical protein
MRSSTSARVDVRARVYRTVGAAALLLTIASSCTSEPERRDLPDVDVGIPADPTTATSAAAPTVASDVAGLTGRLAVLDADGHLVTMNPDGSDEIILDEVAPGTSQVRQPTWSPDGRSVAWVHVEVTEAGAVSASIATAGDDGTRPSMSRTEVVPFYLSWDPTSSRIAYLGAPSDTFIELGVLELADRSSGKSLDAGQPVFFSWGRTAISCSCTSARNGSTGSASTVRRARSATGRGPSPCRCGPPTGRPSSTRRRTGTGNVSSRGT